MKSKTIRNLLTVFILVLGIGCCFIPFLNSRVTTARAEAENPSLMFLDGDIPATFFTGNKNGNSLSETGRSFIRDGDNIMLSNNEIIVLTLNPEDTSNPTEIIDKLGNVLSSSPTRGKLRTISSIDATVQVDASTTYTIDFSTPSSFIQATGNTSNGPKYVITIDKDSSIATYLNGNPSGPLSNHIAGYYTLTFWYNTDTANNLSYTLHFTIFDEETFTTQFGTAISIKNASQISEKTEGDIKYNQAYAYNFNQIDNDTSERLYPTLKVEKPTAFGVSFTHIFNSKATKYQFRNISGNTIYYDVTNSAGVTTQTSFELTENEFVLPLSDFGEYSFTVDYLNNGSIITLPSGDTGKAYEAKSLVIFGFKATYTDADGVKQELYKYDTDYESWANTSSSLSFGGDSSATPAIYPTEVSFANKSGANGIPTTNLTPIKFEYLGKLTGSDVIIDGTHSTGYTYGASYSSAGTYAITINYTYTFNGITLTGGQVFKFKIDLTAPTSIFATKSGETYTPFSQKYTNQDIYLLTEYSTNPFMSPVGVDYDYYADYGTTSTNVVLQQQSSTATVGEGEEKYIVFSVNNTSPSISRSNNGRYEIHFTFGEKLNKLVDKRELFIDSTPISGIELRKIGKNDSSLIDDGSLGTALTTLTNQSFGYRWNEKTNGTGTYETGKSGAKTWVTYQYIEINKNLSSIDDSDRLQYFIDGLGLLNDYTLNTVRNEITNKDLCKNLISGTTANNTFSNTDMGIYIFYFGDEAGNKTTRVVIADNTTPYVLQESLKESATVTVSRIREKVFTHKDYTLTINGTATSVAVSKDATTYQNISISSQTFNFYGKTFTYTPAQPAEGETPAVDDSLTYVDFLEASYDPAETLNVQTKDTVLTWGKYKTLNISTNVANFKFINGNTSLKTLLGNYIDTSSEHLLIPISSVSYIKKGTDGSLKGSGNIAITNTNVGLYASTNSLTIANVYSIPTFVGEGTYTFTINSNNTDAATYTREVIISNDRSSGRFNAKGSNLQDSTLNDTTFELMTGSATTLNELYFSFKNTAETTVKAILVDFYPFVDNGTEYPFASEPASREVIYYIGDTAYTEVYYNGQRYTFSSTYAETGAITTGIINAVGGISQAGKYIITRIYTTSTESNPLTNQSGVPLVGEANVTPVTEEDGVIRNYYFYIDRNDIVSSDLGKAGQEIKLVLANNDATENIIFKNWGRNTNAGVLKTNKVPVAIYIPYNKYFNGDESLAYTNLIVKVTFTPTNNNVSIKTYSADAKNIEDKSGKYFVINLSEIGNFSQAGIYEIEITDGTANIQKTSATDSVTSPANSMKFKFTIEHTAPQATLVVKESDSLNNATLVGNSYYTNVKSDPNNALYFLVTDPTDPYTARIKTVTVDGIVYNLPDETTNNYSADDLLSKIEVTPLSTSIFEGVTYKQKSYKVYLKYSVDKVYNVKFSYLEEGQSNIYLVNGTDFSSVTYRVVLDRQKPDTNIDSLINSDSYLASLAVEDFKVWQDVNDTANINNYVFYVGETTTLIKETNEFDSFYVRPFNISNDKLCLTPDNSIYNDASQQNGHPQFSESEYLLSLLNFKNIDYGTGTLAEQLTSAFGTDGSNNFISGWYEIVERDYAGNYRNYLIYLDLQEETNDIYSINVSQNETPSIIGTQLVENTYLDTLSIDSVSSKLSWYSLKITNLSTNAFEILKWNPTTNSTINNYIETLKGYLNNATSNTRFKLEFTGSYNYTCYINLLKEHVLVAVPQLETTTVGDTATYKLKFPTTSTSSAIYLVGIEIRTNNTVIASFGPKFEISFPSDMKYTLPSKGVYTVRYYDNWTQTSNGASDTGYDYYMVIGELDIPDSERYIYSGNTITKDNLTFTNDDVTVQFNSAIHTVRVFVDGSQTEKTFTSTTGTNGYKNIVLTKSAFNVSNLTEASGGEIKYTIKFYSDNNEISAMTKEIVIFNKISGFEIKDSSGQQLNFTSDDANQTSQIVEVSWDELDTTYSSSVNNFKATLYFLGTTFGSQYYKESQVTSYGNYRLTLENLDLGYSRDLIFRIIEKDSNLYSVELNGTALIESPLTLDITSSTNNILSTLKSKIAAIDTNVLSESVKNKIAADLINVELKQYFSNDSNIGIVTNTDNSLSILYFTFVDGVYQDYYTESDIRHYYYEAKRYESAWANKYVTYIALVYGVSNPIYEELVSMTIVPYTTEFKSGTTDLLNFNLVNKAGGLVSLAGASSKELTSENIENSTATLIWKKSTSSAWYAAGNITYMTYSYASQTNPMIYGTNYDSSNYKATISGAGNHTASFKDWAGNEHHFSLTSQTYTLSLLDSVVYKINNKAPIQYAIYNGNVQLDIDPTFVSKYMPNSLSVSIRRNGNLIDVNSTNPGFTTTGYTYVFTKSGRYEITISAQYRGGYQLNEAVCNFSIIDPTSARLAWEFNEIDGYEIVKILKDDLDITETVANGSAINKIFISTSTSEWGVGSYTVYIKSKTTNVLEGQTFGFSFKIRNEVPVIVSSLEYGGTTKGTITLQYNRAQIFDSIGNSELRILTYDSKSSTFKSFGTISITNDQSDISTISTIALNQTNDYYVQLVTDSGNVVLSFRVNREEPLNTLAIIIIVISIAAVVILTIVFIKLRTKMKIR